MAEVWRWRRQSEGGEAWIVGGQGPDAAVGIPSPALTVAIRSPRPYFDASAFVIRPIRVREVFDRVRRSLDGYGDSRTGGRHADSQN